MSLSSHSLLRAVLGLVLAVTCFQPLWAQLDPKLQPASSTNPTDFLDLYQQSTSLKAKPEIATIFDCSGSMNSLMFHPLYQNNDVYDQDDYRYMTFTYHAGTSQPASQTYTITAYDNACNAATATYTVTVTASGVTMGNGAAPTSQCPATAAGSLTAPGFTITAKAVGNTSASASIVFVASAQGDSPSYNISTDTTNGSKTPGPYEITNATKGTTNPITVTVISGSANPPYATGTVLQFTTYLECPATESGGNSFAVAWSGGPSSTPTPTQISTGFMKSVSVNWTIPAWTHTPASAGNPTELQPITLVSGSAAVGSKLVFSTYYQVKGSSSQINWKVSQPASCAQGAITNVSNGKTYTTGNTTSGPASGTAGQMAWTIPVLCGTTTDPYVSVTLDASKPTTLTSLTPYDSGITYVGSLMAATNTTAGYEALRRPDGTAVTAANFTTATSMLGYGNAMADVRNWIRQASHVRFTNGSRTIDIPIPWKIMNAGSTGNPQSSTTVYDQETTPSTANGVTTTTNYGSFGNIELDQTYKIEGVANAVLTADVNGSKLTSSTASTVVLFGVAYRPAYISWLFNGVYQGTDHTKPYYTTNSSLTVAGSNYIAFDAMHNALVGNQSSVSWGQAFGPAGTSWGTIAVPQVNADGTWPGGNLPNAPDASSYAIPSMTRLQAVKNAAISTWIAHQADVFWAFRELDPTVEAQFGAATTIDDNSQTTITGATPIPPTGILYGTDSGWTVLNNYLASDSTTTTSGNTVTVTSSATGHSVLGMTRIAYLAATSETPLTYAMARTLAQFEDPTSVFNAVEGANVSNCQNSFLMLFTDGLDNNGVLGSPNTNATTPYIVTENGVPSLDANAGNQTIIGNQSSINPGNSYWNLFTFAGIAAHLADPTLANFMPQGTPPPISPALSPSGFLPFAIKQRGSGTNLVPFTKDHRVTVMTVGVSLGGTVTSASGPKQSLFWTAVAGDPATTTGALSTFHTFVPPNKPLVQWPGGANPPAYPAGWVANDWVYNPSDPVDYPKVGQRAAGAVYFFDASDPSKLSYDMQLAFQIAIGAPGNNATSNPNLPFTGASLGQEILMGSFQPPAIGGVVWPGDLLMFATRNTNGTVSILDKAGNTATALSATTAQWSAAASMSARSWSARTLYTRFPASGTSTEPGLSSFPVSWTATSFTSGTDPIFSYVSTVGSQSLATKQADLEFAAGGDTSVLPPTSNRSNIMGDIIDSAPAAIEYAWNDVKTLVGSNTILNAVGGNRFRLILVGDNQGWIHGFGEVTKTISDPNGDTLNLVTGAVDELWAFMPTDFLANLHYLNVSTNPHRFLADGSPSIYFLDLPLSGNGPGNGVVDLNNSERAIAVIGEGKGGRSYYALNILHPFAPTLQWSLVPDEIAAGFFPTSGSAPRIIPGVTYATNPMTVMANMGFSTCVPAFGRILFKGLLRDAVFLGGGFSEPQVDANYTTPLGRSVLALDVNSGEVLASTILPGTTVGQTTVPGPVGAGLIPFEYILNSGMSQRAYFTDYYGGLWSWGAGTGVDSTGIYQYFREDTSEITSWNIRKVFQDTTTRTSALDNKAYSVAKYTTVPAPFMVSNFQGPALANSATPTAVGVALESGDRNNPLDRFYGTTQNPVEPDHHNLLVVFDRQDSSGFTSLTLDTSGIQFANLEQLSNSALTATPTGNLCTSLYSIFTSGCTNYYLGTALAPMFGYYLPFPSADATSHFLPKGINPPLVVSGSLFYSYFTPLTSDPCTGGTGSTYSFVIEDVMHPVANDQRTGYLGPLGGQIMAWSGVASNFIGIGNTAVLQAGTTKVANPQPGAATTAPAVNTTLLKSGNLYPKVRVWRTVQ